MKEILLTDIELHDAFVLDIQLGSSKNSFDTILITLDSDAFITNYKCRTITLVFKNCLEVKANLLWVQGKDSVQNFEIHKDSELRSEAKKKLKEFRPKSIEHPVINLNSGSTIEMLTTEPVVIEKST